MFVTVILWTAFFAINFNLAMMIPLLPFIQKQFSLTSTETGLVLAAFPVVALLINLTLGPLIDKFGRKRFIIAGAAGCALALLVTALSTGPTAIILGRGITGLFMPMIGASIFAAIADYFPESKRSRVAGYVTSAAPVAFLCSMSMGVVIGGHFSWQLPVLGLSVLCAALVGLACKLKSTDPQTLSSSPIAWATYKTRVFSMSSSVGIRPLLAAYFCWAAGVYVFLGLYPSWLVQRSLADFGVDTVGIVVFVGEVGGLFGALLSGRMGDRFRSPLTLCALASIGIAAVSVVIPFLHGQPVLQALGYTAFAFCRDLMLALILGDTMRLVAASERGSLNSSLNAIYQTGGTLGGLLSAWLYGLSPDFLANAVFASVAFVGAATLLWKVSKLKSLAAGTPALDQTAG